MLRHQAGQNYGRTFRLRSTTARSAFRPSRINTRRQDNINVFDFRVEKVIRVDRGMTVAPFLDLYNVFNANPEQNLTWASGVSFLRPTEHRSAARAAHRRQGELVSNVVRHPLTALCVSAIAHRRLLVTCPANRRRQPLRRRPFSRARHPPERRHRDSAGHEPGSLGGSEEGLRLHRRAHRRARRERCSAGFGSPASRTPARAFRNRPRW